MKTVRNIISKSDLSSTETMGHNSAWQTHTHALSSTYTFCSLGGSIAVGVQASSRWTVRAADRAYLREQRKDRESGFLGELRGRTHRWMCRNDRGPLLPQGGKEWELNDGWGFYFFEVLEPLIRPVTVCITGRFCVVALLAKGRVWSPALYDVIGAVVPAASSNALLATPPAALLISRI